MPLEAEGPNAEQIKYWNDNAGPKWVAMQEVLDAQIRPLGRLAMEKGGIAAGARVLDVGCGCGDTTVEIARRVGPTGAVTGIDISAPMLEQARAAARQAGVANATFENVDAQTTRLPQGAFDVVYSRFGVMFFADAAAAFTNLHSALAPGGRTAFVCWRALHENPWMFIPIMAAAQHIELPPPPAPDAPGPGSFADPERVRGILSTAGFGDIAFEKVDETLSIGRGALDDIVQFLLTIGPTGNAVRDAAERQGEGVRIKVASAVRQALEPYYTMDGVRMLSAAWVVTANASSSSN